MGRGGGGGLRQGPGPGETPRELAISVIATLHIIIMPTVTFLLLLRSCLRKVMGNTINHRVYRAQFKIGFRI